MNDPREARSEFKDVFVRNLARAAQYPLARLCAIERGAGSGSHLHGLLAYTDALAVEAIECHWKLGSARAVRHDRARRRVLRREELRREPRRIRLLEPLSTPR